MHETLHPDVPVRQDPVQQSAVPEDDAPQFQALTLAFTGSGREYFRIWVVNLLLTVATLGIYSAWAKVRRLQYFDRNTQLAGTSFDFHGDPRAILKGRLLAVVMLVAYHYAFGFSAAAGVVIVATLILVLPFLMRGALRFRLSNTSYRGLAFGFSGTVGGAYAAYMPPVATFLWPGVMYALYPHSLLPGLVVFAYLAWPAMHGTMKRYQHRHLAYGNEQSRYELSALRFYRPYLVAFVLALVGGILSVVLVVAWAASTSPVEGAGAAAGAFLLPLLVTLYILFLVAGPYMQVRINNLTWSNTTFPGLRIRSTMTVRGMLRLQIANTLLTLLTLGLFRPFAVVRTYRYRMSHLALEADGNVEDILASARPRHRGATGDGAADFLGVDISW